MKSAFSVLAILCVIGFSSCKNNSETPAGMMTATLGGTPWTANATSVVLLGSSIRISGGDGNSGVSMLILETPTAATFKFDGLDAFGSVMTGTLSTGADFKSNNFGVAGVEGSVSITELNETNHTISGTFSGRVKRDNNDGGAELEINDGKFSNLTYTQSVPVSKISAKINGTLVNPTAVVMVDESGDRERALIYGGYDDMGNIFGFFIATEVVPNTYVLPNVYMSSTDVFCSTALGSDPATSGRFVISYHDRALKTMKGTFEFVASGTYPMKTITDGTFEMYYRQ